MVVFMTSSWLQAVTLENKTAYTFRFEQFGQKLTVGPGSEGRNSKITLEDEIWIYGPKAKSTNKRFSYKAGFSHDGIKIEQHGAEFVFFGEISMLKWKELFRVSVTNRSTDFGMPRD